MSWTVTAEELAAWERAHGGPVERVDDVRLVVACLRGDPLALAAFDAVLAPVAAAAASSMGDRAFVADVQQIVRQRLLVPEPGRAPRLTSWSGRGALSTFLHVVASRAALNLRASAPKAEQQTDDELLLELSTKGDDPEVELLKQRYRGEFKQAFAAALQALPAELRAAVGQYYLDGLTLSDLSRLYGWSIATASRRLADAREQLLATTRGNLSARLQLSQNELDSVLRLIASRLSIQGFNAP